MTQNISTASRYDAMTEEQLMQEMRQLDKDDYFTISMFILPRLKDKHNIYVAHLEETSRYHTYGDCI